MAKRLAITIAGAVSLGSYEAGVLYELLRAVRTHNEATTEPAQKIFIDVLTGASAGGMTAAMVSQRLMFNAAALDGEFTNDLYKAWVERISLRGLVQLGHDEKKWHSLFSSDLIADIGQDMLVRSMQQPGSGPHAAIELVDNIPEPLGLGLALTNLNGIDYLIGIDGNPDQGFNYTSSLDQKLYKITPSDHANSTLWQGVCTAAVGSGAFPVAFRPQAIDHSPAEYGLPTRPAAGQPIVDGITYLDWQGPDPGPFAHSDGGVLQNQPLGIAKDLVDQAIAARSLRLGAAAHCDSADRLYVFVSPNAVKSTAQDLVAAKINIWDELKQLFAVYTRQAAFHDWIRAEGINKKVKILDQRAHELAGAITAGDVDLDALGKASLNLNDLLVKAPERQLQITRLREQYSVEHDLVLSSQGQAAAETYLSALATLESAAQLQGRDVMQIVAVIANGRTELAGSGSAAFVGFFKKSYRQHDYWMGRVKTRTYLQRPDVKKILAIAHWPEESTWSTPLPNPSGVTLPLKNSQVFGAAFLPLLIMILIRPALLLTALILTALISTLLVLAVRHHF